jgi:hypothetical protein
MINVKNLLKPLNLARIIIGLIIAVTSIYVLVYLSETDNTSFNRIFSIQQILMSVFFLLNWIDELKKPDSKKLIVYGNLTTAFIIIVLVAIKYLR